MRFHNSHTELTTAATDAVLAVVCAALVWWLFDVRPSWPRSVWLWLFALTALASGLGAAAHGFALTDRARNALWQPLYVSLGLTIALFVVAAISDWRGEAAARSFLPWALAIGIGFYAMTYFLNGAFIIFVAYEAIAMFFVLGVYSTLWLSRSLPGAPLIVVGIALSIVAAAVQASTMTVRAGVTFDHNGLFHLIQLVGMVVLASGVRLTLQNP
jgi:hypothetical protein